MAQPRMIRIGALAAIAALLFAACGKEAPAATKGGTLEIVANGDVDYIDPGQIYYNWSYMLFRVMIRNLVSFPTSTQDDPGTQVVADLATDTGTVSKDGLTYTFTLRDGLKWPSDIAGGRDITSADIRYGIERGLLPKLANGYVGLYFTDVIVGDTEFTAHKTRHISGIDVSDAKKIVFHLRRPTGDFTYRLALPVAAPVPEEYAAPFDAKNPSTYGPNFASSGPYMLERKAGKVTGYVAGKKIIMVRNPSWDAGTDPIRKGYPDRIEVYEGFQDANLAVQKVLNGSYDLTAADVAIPASKLKTIVSSPTLERRIAFDKTAGAIGYIFMNTKIKPFDNVLVRRAVNFVMDKYTQRLVTGGALKGDIATNVLMPGVLGFDAVGGASYDPYTSPGHKGDVAKAQALMKQAGYASGKYNGPPVRLVDTNDSVARQVDDVVEANLLKIGIKVKREVYDPNIMFTKYYSVPKANVAMGTGSGWFMDYPDGYTVIKALFDGRLITPTANNNYSLINDAKLNQLIDKAAAASGDERAKLWADADRRVMELAPVVPTIWQSSPQVFSTRVPRLDFTLGVGAADLATISVKTTTK